jgi:DNA polymerase III subunit beta
MQNQFHVSQSTLDAMLLLAGKKDIRYYLNGLNIEWNSELTRAIGCDGHKLGIFQAAAPDNRGAGSITIPRDAIESLPKKCGVLTFSQVSETHWQIDTGTATIKFAPCDSKYPDFRRVVHPIQTAGTSGVAAGFNLEYLNQFEKCGNLLAGSKSKHGNRVRIYHNGTSGAMAMFDGVDGFAGVIMPLRDSIGSTGALFPAELTSELTAAQPEPVAA